MQFQKQGCQISLESTSYSLISLILFRSRIVHHGDNNSHVICCTPEKVTWFEFSFSGEENIFFKEIPYMYINRMKTASQNICTLHIVYCGKYIFYPQVGVPFYNLQFGYLRIQRSKRDLRFFFLISVMYFLPGSYQCSQQLK